MEIDGSPVTGGRLFQIFGPATLRQQTICRRMWIPRAAHGASMPPPISFHSAGRQSVDRSQPGTTGPGRSSTCGRALPAWTWLADGRAASATSAGSAWCAQIVDTRQPVTNCAAAFAFCTDCSRWDWLSAMPYNKALQLSRRQLMNARTSVLAASGVSDCTTLRSWRSW